MNSRKGTYRIREATSETYFKGMCGIGPMFGATFKDAVTFAGGWQAYEVMKSFPLVVDAELVNERGQKCDVSGKAMKESP